MQKAIAKIEEMLKVFNLGKREYEETVKFFVSRIEESESLEKDILKEEKTAEGMLKYVRGKARKMAKNSMAAIGSCEVFEWIEDYFYAKEEPKKEKAVATPKKAESKPKTKTKAKSEPVQFDFFSSITGDDEDDDDDDEIDIEEEVRTAKCKEDDDPFEPVDEDEDDDDEQGDIFAIATKYAKRKGK